MWSTDSLKFNAIYKVTRHSVDIAHNKKKECYVDNVHWSVRLKYILEYTQDVLLAPSGALYVVMNP